MSRFSVMETPISGLKLIERMCIGDQRGFLARVFCAEELASHGWRKPIAQINHTLTQTRGTVRGIHFQRPPHAEMKLVTCIRGNVWDVAVDLRRGSPTFLKWRAEQLSAENRRAFLIPEGFGHGFQTLSDEVELLYCHSAPFATHAEGGLNPRDPRLAIDWPLAVAQLSTRDANQALIADTFEGLVL
jgi:dTDP-4-dehydrorhamnose 3,5-epimerase